MRVGYLLLAAIPILATPTGLQGQSRDADVRAATGRILPKLIEVRHDLHRHPELGNRETRTAALVARELRRLGLEVRTGVAKTGVVGVLRGGRPGRVVGVRADMDALPVTEQTDLPFKSVETTTYLGRQTGVSHACGHDIHVTVALGVAEVLSGFRNRLQGSVVFYFQPAEEGPPKGEEGGAKLMIAEGVLRSPKPDFIFAFHANGDPPDEAGDWERVGKISYTPGPQYAAATAWSARIIGRQAHGATPHLGIDAIVTASQIVANLQTIRARTLSPFEPAVVTVGVFQAGDRRNIIAGEAHLEGTIRTFSDSIATIIKTRMREVFAGTAAAAGARFELEFDEAIPVTVNDTALARRFHPVLGRAVGAENVGIVPPETGAEDFSFFAQEVPSFYFKLGAVASGNTSGGHHTPTFRADDEAIPVGVRAMTAVVLEALAKDR
ncbi:MAG TPA: amidohydrolase [Gemmatimonadales bacterium]|nr:amidohydrolase [Gemmatimonadales bacterium]